MFNWMCVCWGGQGGGGRGGVPSILLCVLGVQGGGGSGGIPSIPSWKIESHVKEMPKWKRYEAYLYWGLIHMDVNNASKFRQFIKNIILNI